MPTSSRRTRPEAGRDAMGIETTKSLPFAEVLDRAAEARGPEPEWIEGLRRAGVVIYREAGMPTPKVEAWKYTNLNKLARIAFEPASSEADVAALPAEPALALEGALRVVSANGALRRDLSDLDAIPDGLEIKSLATAVAEEPDVLSGELGRLLDVDGRPLAALNAACWRDGLLIRVAEGAEIERPVHLFSVGAPGAAPTMFHPRTLIVASKGSSATVAESHVSLAGAPTFANPVAEVSVGEGAVLHHYKLVDEAPEAYHIATSALALGKDAHYDSFTLTLGGRLVRNEVHLRLAGSGSEGRINGAYLCDGETHVDNTILVEHAAPGASSHQTFKGVLYGTSRGVFQGKILVRKVAQKTDGYQLHQALLLSPGAEVDAKPELEIYADDVKCSHGATTGELDEDALFYLRARGIEEAHARRLLIEAFLMQALEEVQPPAVAEALGSALVGGLGAINAKLGRQGGAR